MFSIKNLFLFSMAYFFAFSTYSEEGDKKNLCSVDEYVQFSCQLDNKKIVSLCSKNNEKKVSEKNINSIGLVYRYGTESNIELNYPNDANHSNFGYKSIRQEATEDENKYYSTRVHFSLGNYKYIVGNSEVFDAKSWLAVDKNGNEIFYSQCNDNLTYSNVDIFQYYE
ncbi:hypothetical protein ACFSJQ_06740 [Vibrio olivae]|uniref:Uncharacterized protein n=1 Tax=Vibrio olivae TaxID=1243002 RepID=A0ABV5HIP5_9VIBR